jgi:MFS family permease
VESPPWPPSAGAPSLASQSSVNRRSTALRWVVASDFAASVAIALAMVVLVLRIYAESHGSSWLVVAGLMGVLAAVNGVWIVVVALTAVGAIWAVAIPAGLSLVPVIAEDATTRANGWIHAAGFAGAAIGALTAAALPSSHGEAAALSTTAAVTAGTGTSYLLLARCWRRRAAGARRQDLSAVGGRGWVDLGGRVRLLLKMAEVRWTVLGAAAMILLIQMIAVAEVFLAERVLHAGAIGYSAMITVWTTGMVVGTALAGGLRSTHLVRATLWSIVGAGAALALVGLQRDLYGVLALYGLAGIANGVEVVGLASLAVGAGCCSAYSDAGLIEEWEWIWHSKWTSTSRGRTSRRSCGAPRRGDGNGSI